MKKLLGFILLILPLDVGAQESYVFPGNPVRAWISTPDMSTFTWNADSMEVWYQYDAQGRLTRSGRNSVLPADSSMLYLYYKDAAGQDTLILTYERASGSWAPVERTRSTYLPDGRLSGDDQHRYISSWQSYESIFHQTYTFDVQGRPLVLQIDFTNPPAQTEPYRRIEWHYPSSQGGWDSCRVYWRTVPNAGIQLTRLYQARWHNYSLNQVDTLHIHELSNNVLQYVGYQSKKYTLPNGIDSIVEPGVQTGRSVYKHFSQGQNIIKIRYDIDTHFSGGRDSSLRVTDTYDQYGTNISHLEEWYGSSHWDFFTSIDNIVTYRTSGPGYTRLYHYESPAQYVYINSYRANLEFGPVAVQDDISHQLKISPNPAHTVVEIRLPQTQGLTQIQIRDLTGRLLVQGQLQPGQTKVPVSILPPGIYQLQAETGGKLYQARLVKE